MVCSITSKCIFCGICEAVCPLRCIESNEEEEMMKINADKCVGCGKCADLCPIGAISKKG